MATIDQYKIKIDVEGENQVKGLTKSLSGLGTTLAGIGFGAFVANAFRMADAINDIADATGLTAGYVKGLGTAIQQAGGDMNDVSNIVNRFYQNIDDLANGSDKAINAFEKLGIKQEDLLKLSRQDVLGLTLKRLAEMGPSAERTALGIEIFGKAFGRIDPKKLDEILKTQDFAKLDAEVRKAGEAFGAMEDNILTLQQAVLAVLAPFVGQVENMRLSAEQAEKIIKSLAIAIGIAFGARTVLNIIEVTKAMRQLVLMSNLLGKNPAIKLLAGGALALGAGAAIDKLMEAENIAFPEVGGTAGPAEQAAAASTIEASQKEKAAKATERTTLELVRQNQIANQLQRTINSTIGMEENRAEIIKTTAQIEADFANKRLQLSGQISAELAKGKDTNVAVLQSLKDQLTELSKQEQISKQLSIDALQRNLLERERVALIDNNIKKIQEMADFEKEANDMYYRQIIAQGGITEKEAQRRLTLENAIAEKRAKLYTIDGNIAKETDAIKKKILQDEYNRLEQIENKKIETIKRRYELEDELQNSLIAGSVSAFEQIAAATKPYKMAQDAILSTWSKIGSAIDTFIETGKFKFKDFAASVIADLTKIIAKALILQSIQAIFGAFGFKIPGLAAGGPAKAGEPYIVGEKGPELFVPKNAGTVIPNNKMPMKQEGIATGAVNAPVTNNYITNNINAVDAKSVAQLFAENRKVLLGTVKMAERELPYMA